MDAEIVSRIKTRTQGNGNRQRTVEAVVTAVRVEDGEVVSKTMLVPAGLPGFTVFVHDIFGHGYEGLCLRRVS